MQLSASATEILTFVTMNPSKETGEIALHLRRGVENTRKILNHLRFLQLVDCLYSERLEQTWYPVIRLSASKYLSKLGQT